MKVREYIQELQKLDQEKNIWVMPNIFHVFPPFPFEEALEGDEKLFEEEKFDIVVWRKNPPSPVAFP